MTNSPIEPQAAETRPTVDLTGPLPRVELNLLPDVDNSRLPQSPRPRQ